jgi:hypothetical protein
LPISTSSGLCYQSTSAIFGCATSEARNPRLSMIINMARSAQFFICANSHVICDCESFFRSDRPCLRQWLGSRGLLGNA